MDHTYYLDVPAVDSSNNMEVSNGGYLSAPLIRIRTDLLRTDCTFIRYDSSVAASIRRERRDKRRIQRNARSARRSKENAMAVYDKHVYEIDARLSSVLDTQSENHTPLNKRKQENATPDDVSGNGVWASADGEATGGSKDELGELTKQVQDISFVNTAGNFNLLMGEVQESLSRFNIAKDE